MTELLLTVKSDNLQKIFFFNTPDLRLKNSSGIQNRILQTC